MKKLHIQPSFILLLVTMIALGYPGQFFILFLSVILHETAHITVALFFGLKFKKIIMKPIGEIAIIDGSDTVFYKRLLTILSGPLVNVLMAGFIRIFFRQAEFLITVNLIICLFNLLPVLPLDGGRILYNVLSVKMGNLTAGKLLLRLTRVASMIFILIGLIQVVLYPYDISLFCVGIYIYRTSKKECENLVFDFYEAIAQESKMDIMPVKHFYIKRETPLQEVIDKICVDNYSIFYINGGEDNFCVITQKQLVNHIFEKGIQGIMGDIFTEKIICQDLY